MKTIALVAHDNRKADLLEWVRFNSSILASHRLVCTGTTGKRVQETLRQEFEDEKDQPPMILLKSGPLGGDQQLGARIAEGGVDMLVFFWDPMQPQPHDVDVKALLRISVLYNVPTACNRSTADYMIASRLMDDDYVPVQKDYSAYLERDLPE